jgi:CelD/BcsL family acetyltransferase involved in cellulose biosynthesis
VNSHPVCVSVAPLLDRNRFLDEWRSFESYARTSPFLSTAWVGALLETLPGSTPLFRAIFSVDRRSVGCGLFGRASVRNRWAMLDALSLNSVGISQFDSPHIEMNGLLVPEQLAAPAADALLRFVDREFPSLQCVLFPGVERTEPFVEATKRTKWIADSSASAAPYVDLSKVRARGGDYIALLRKKSRYAARKARSAYTQRYGPLRVVAARNAMQIESTFEQLKRWNVDRFAKSGTPSAFETPYFVDFHRALLRRGVANNTAQLLSVFAGEQLLACIYTLQSNGWACFYQSGFDYSLLGRDAQPGFGTLPLVVEHYANLGYQAFDFLADGARYKWDLATDSRDLHWVSATRPTLLNRAAHAARAIRRRVSR